MKHLSYLILLFLCILLAYPSRLYAQNTSNYLNFKNIELRLAIDSLASVTGLRIAYTVENIPKVRISQRISLKDKEQSLVKLISPHQLQFKLIAGQYVITKSQAKTPQLILIMGLVKDFDSKEPIPGATIQFETGLGTCTNAQGYFVIPIKSDSVGLTISSIGYKKLKKTVFKTKAIQEIHLTPQEYATTTVEILDSASAIGSISGEVKLSTLQLRSLPAFAGDADIIKSLGALPGITNYGDGSSKYFVRGGGNEQNLLLLDGCPVYNTSHLFGFFTAIPSESISAIDTWKGDAPPSFGGATSSVLNIQPKDPNLESTGFSLTTGPYTTQFTADGPLIENNAGWLIGGRLSHINWVDPSNSLIKQQDASFYDIQGRSTISLNANNKLRLTFYFSNDQFLYQPDASVTTFGSEWYNISTSAKWLHFIGHKTSTTAQIWFSSYAYNLFLSKELDHYWQSYIQDIGAKYDINWYPTENIKLVSGLELGSFYSQPGKIYQPVPDPNELLPSIAAVTSLKGALWSNVNWKILSHLKLSAGLRLALWAPYGPADIWSYDNLGNAINQTHYNNNEIYDWFLRLEPRIGLTYNYNNWSFRGGYAKHHQFQQSINNSISPFMVPEVWITAGPNIKPQMMEQYNTAAELKLGDGLSTGIEIWYRKFNNLIDYTNHANLLFNDKIEGELVSGEGEAYGAEFQMRRSGRYWGGWATLTVSRSTRTTLGINNDKTYVNYFDRPLSSVITLFLKPTPWLQINTAWYWMSGNPTTTPTGFFIYNGQTLPVYDERNNDRLPDYHRLDLTLAITLPSKSKRWQHTLSLTLYNAYAHHNPFAVNYNKTETSDGDIVVPVNLSGEYQLMPTVTSVAGVIPSINYQIRFR